MKKIFPLVSFYGFAVLIGGLMGYATAGSKPSLIAGFGFGSALLLCAYGIKKQKYAAPYIALILTFLLDGVFTQRFLKTFRFFPSGFMSLLSLIMLVILTLHLRTLRSSPSKKKT